MTGSFGMACAACLMLGACSLLDRDLDLIDVGGASECYPLSRNERDGALACYALRQGTCHRTADQGLSPTGEFSWGLSNGTASATSTHVVPEPRLNLQDTFIALHSRGNQHEALWHRPGDDGRPLATSTAVRFIDPDDEDDWGVGEFALAMTDENHAVGLAVRRNGCARGTAELVGPVALQHPTTEFAMRATDVRRCSDNPLGASLPRVALKCTRARCANGLGAFVNEAAQSASRLGTLTLVSFEVVEHLERQAPVQHTVSGVQTNVAPQLVTLDGEEPMFALAYVGTRPEGCGQSPEGEGIVVRRIDESGRPDHCAFIPEVGAQALTMAADGGADGDEQVMLLWTAPSGGRHALRGALLRLSDSALTLQDRLTIASAVDPTVAPSLAYAPYGLSTSTPTGFWSALWAETPSGSQASVGRIAANTLEQLPQETWMVPGGHIDDLFAFYSSGAPLGYGLTFTDAKNVAWTRALMCAR